MASNLEEEKKDEMEGSIMDEKRRFREI